jgi:DNA-binding CsgD family transcriptional regulator
LEAAEAVCSAGHDRTSAVLDVTGSLVESSLIQRHENSGDGPRFGMFETVREFGLEQLLANGDDTVLRRRHAEYFQALAAAVEPKLRGVEQAFWLARLEQEHDNLRAALAWYLDDGHNPDRGLRLAAALGDFWWHRGYLREGLRWLESALAASSGQPSPSRAAAAYHAGEAARSLGEYSRAEALQNEALAIGSLLGDRRRVANALNGLGQVARERESYAEGWRLLQESAAIFKEQGDTEGLARALSNVGLLAYLTGDDPQAAVVLAEALDICRSLHNTLGIGRVATFLGDVEQRRGHNERAMALFTEGARKSREVGDDWSVVRALNGVGKVASAHGEWARAVRLFGAADAHGSIIGARWRKPEQATVDGHLAAARAHLGQHAFETAWAEGRALSLDAAVALALKQVESGENQPTDVPRVAVQSLPDGLSPREAEVLRLLAEGRTNQEIAEGLVLSVRTVENHTARIYGKIGARGRAEATAYAFRHQLL